MCKSYYLHEWTCIVKKQLCSVCVWKFFRGIGCGLEIFYLIGFNPHRQMFTVGKTFNNTPALMYWLNPARSLKFKIIYQLPVHSVYIHIKHQVCLFSQTHTFLNSTKIYRLFVVRAVLQKQITFCCKWIKNSAATCCVVVFELEHAPFELEISCE